MVVLLQSIDCSKALAMEGVLAVMTGDDLVTPGNEMLGSGEGAMALKDVVPMVMSQGKVLFHSQAVAAVAAVRKCCEQGPGARVHPEEGAAAEHAELRQGRTYGAGAAL